MGAGLGDYASAKRDQYGLMRCRGFVWKPYYGPGVKLKDPPFRVRILDYGKDLEQALGAGPDRVILICDGSSWSRSSTFFSVEQVVKGRIPYGIVYNHAAGGIRIRLPEGAAPSRCLKAPYYPDPFAPDAEAEDFYKVFLEEILEIKIRRKKGISGLAGWIAQRLTVMLPGKDRTFGKG